MRLYKLLKDLPTVKAGIQTVVCKGCDAAIEFIESITK